MIIKQFGKPTGVVGRLIGSLMAIKNKDRVRWTVKKLQVRPSDILLEIGYGPGVTVAKLANYLTSSFIAGIDHSSVMLEQATRRNKKLLETEK